MEKRKPGKMDRWLHNSYSAGPASPWFLLDLGHLHSTNRMHRSEPEVFVPLTRTCRGSVFPRKDEHFREKTRASGGRVLEPEKYRPE
ncbi:hypothetical protein JEQ12_006487 [Ovis aries]|uniref:Uncharacterized protein n=1 Tax=Ovis aries TaxID=9940 RepID=A0A835ZSL2_SHEEP|nr:hypothetical protein JEQ12_006487 [Ovis aries]